MMYFLKNVCVTLKTLFPLTLADTQYPFLFSLGFDIIPSHAELQKELCGGNFNYKTFCATNHNHSEGHPQPTPSHHHHHRAFLKQHSTHKTLPGQCQSRMERSAQKSWRQKESSQKAGVPKHPLGACVEAYPWAQGKTKEIKGHLLETNCKS